ncbi:MAG: hypothetical protein Kow0077_13470 [Anaerolineae bacterium]
MSQTICVFASSSDAIAPIYFEAAEQLGRLMAERGHTLIYGGGGIGLMGAVARGMHAGGGRVIGVIPQKLIPQGYDGVDEMIVTETMRERKAIMEDRADAFVVLPGGFGTLEEVLEVLTLKQLGYHHKAITLLNTGGFWEPLLQTFEHLFRTHFADDGLRASYHVAATPEAALAYIAAYRPAELPDKLALLLQARQSKDGQDGSTG